MSISLTSGAANSYSMRPSGVSTIFGPRRYHVCPSPDYARELTRTFEAARPSGGKKRG